jgi:hypothetical protein
MGNGQDKGLTNEIKAGQANILQSYSELPPDDGTTQKKNKAAELIKTPPLLLCEGGAERISLHRQAFSRIHPDDCRALYIYKNPLQVLRRA